MTKIINERTGKMQEMKNPCIILDSVVCKARYSDCRMFCPREIYSWWREIWLERVDSNTNSVETSKVSGQVKAEAELQTAGSVGKNCN